MHTTTTREYFRNLLENAVRFLFDATLLHNNPNSKMKNIIILQGIKLFSNTSHRCNRYSTYIYIVLKLLFRLLKADKT